MALINMGTADGSLIGNPEVGNFYLFMDSSNSNLLTKRNSDGTDLVYSIGEGINNLGWVALTDQTFTELNPLTILSGVDKVLEFNKDSFIDTYSPETYGVDDFFDTPNNRIKSPTIGYAYLFRLTFKCVPSANSRQITVAYSIGTSVNSQIIVDQRSSELRTSGQPSFISSSSLVYSLGTFITNGMEVILTTTTDCDVYDISMVLARIS